MRKNYFIAVYDNNDGSMYSYKKDIAKTQIDNYIQYLKSNENLKESHNKKIFDMFNSIINSTDKVAACFFNRQNNKCYLYANYIFTEEQCYKIMIETLINNINTIIENVSK